MLGLFITVLSAPLILAAPRAPSCPADARLVEGEHMDTVDHECTGYKWGHCSAYAPGVVKPKGARTKVRVCMDAYEAPNVKGAKPLVMLSAIEAGQWCKNKGKRLCSELEWETACEGPQRKPWTYGWASDATTCNTGKPWLAFDVGALMNGGARAQLESDRLWQGEVSGARAGCSTREGVHDLVGNVEEWTTASRPRRYPVVLMGGFWAKPWTHCRDANDAHEPQFRFYEVGFRCCAEAKP